MNAKHTPGPWHVGVRQAEQIVYNAQGWAVANATVYHGREDVAECKANARLIAEAPAMAEALRSLFEHCAMIHKHWGEGSNGREADAAQENARAILARIGG